MPIIKYTLFVNAQNQSEQCLLASANLLRFTSSRTSVIYNTGIRGIVANISERSRVTIVLINANELTAVLSCDTLHNDSAFTLAGAISTRSVHLTIVLGVEIDHIDSAAAIMLDYLV